MKNDHQCRCQIAGPLGRGCTHDIASENGSRDETSLRSNPSDEGKGKKLRRKVDGDKCNPSIWILIVTPLYKGLEGLERGIISDSPNHHHFYIKSEVPESQVVFLYTKFFRFADPDTI